MNTPKNMSGALFRNTRKEKDTHPDYNGSVVINGQHLWISAWLKETVKGSKYLSLAFKPKEETYKNGVRSGPANHDLDDEIPF